jgi:DNA-binding XRE family transcriptional regulator
MCLRKTQKGGAGMVNKLRLEKLRQMREERGLTCEQMAYKLGLQTKSGYNKKEKGRTPFTLKEAKIISDAFGQSIDDIFFPREVSRKDTSRCKEAGA